MSCHGKDPIAEGQGETVAHARAWWLVALIAVPAVLAGLALPWAGAPSSAAPLPGPATAPPSPPTSAAAPVVGTDPAPVEPPDPTVADIAQVLATQPIRFTADSAVLAGPAADTVRRVGELLAAGPAVPVLVEGHVADTPGGPDAVQRLSDQRAAVVAEALVVAGVPAERITARGAGASRPLATVEESRRVEITVG
jgi:outer membrane protein OmpA-like peptidoglycan-associated protein